VYLSRCGGGAGRLLEDAEASLGYGEALGGRYPQSRSYWPVALFGGCALIVAGTVLLFA